VVCRMITVTGLATWMYAVKDGLTRRARAPELEDWSLQWQ